MANDTGQPNRLGGTYSAIVGALGALTSILALVQLFTTENTLIITLLFTAVLGLAVIALHHTWHSAEPRLRWLGSLTVAALVLASLGGGYGLGRATAPKGTPPATTPSTTAGAGPNTTPAVIATSGGNVTSAPTSTPPAGDLLFTRVTPATTRLGFFNSWKIDSVSVETVEYDEAIVATVVECASHGVRYAEYVLGRKYKRLTGRVTLADDSELTDPVPLVIVLDGTAAVRKKVTTTPLELDVDLTGVNRIRFELTTPGNSCAKYSKLAFVGLTAHP